MGWHLNPRYGQVILVSRCPVLTAVKWWQHWCAISFLLCPQTSCMVVWLPNFLGWVDILTHAAPLACARALVHNFRKGVGYCLLSQLEMAIDPSVTITKVHVYQCEFPSPCFAGIQSEEWLRLAILVSLVSLNRNWNPPNEVFQRPKSYGLHGRGNEPWPSRNWELPISTLLHTRLDVYVYIHVKPFSRYFNLSQDLLHTLKELDILQFRGVPAGKQSQNRKRQVHQDATISSKEQIRVRITTRVLSVTVSQYHGRNQGSPVGKVFRGPFYFSYKLSQVI